MIYCVEDEDSIRNLMTYALEASGFTAKGFPDSVEFFKAVAEKKPDLVLLDIMLPGKDGLEILRSLRSDPATAKIPVIMASARGTEFDKVTGLDLGADDYLAKPFGMMELTARVRALLRRANPKTAELCYQAGCLSVWPKKHTVRVAGEEVSLTRKEFDLLCLLLKNEDQVVTREQLIQEVWGYAYQGESRTVDVHVRTLRQKLGQAGELIETVRGVGYRIRRRSDEA